MRRIIFAILAIASFSAFGSGYVDSLRSKYEGRIGYVSSKAAETVKAFNIDCRRDDRFLRLEHLLFARLREGDGENAWLTMRIDSRDGEVRIYDQVQYKAGGFSKERLVFEISKWDQLSPVGISTEAVLNACIGSAGPIWTATKTPAAPSVWIRFINNPRGDDKCVELPGTDDVIEVQNRFMKRIGAQKKIQIMDPPSRESAYNVASILRVDSVEQGIGDEYMIIATSRAFCNDVRGRNIAALFNQVHGNKAK